MFTIELLLQFIYRGLALFTDGWLIFDFVIIIMSWSLESLQIVRTFRVFRALRLVTRVEVLKKLVMALFAVGPRMSAISALLLLIFYIYAVMMTILFGDLYEQGYTEYDYFSRLDITLWSLFVIMTLDWAEIARPVMAVYPWAWLPFISFIMVSSFIVYNLIIAVVCDAVSIAEHEQEGEAEEHQEIENANQIMQLTERVNTLKKQQQEVLEALEAAMKEIGIDMDIETVSNEISKEAADEKLEEATKAIAVEESLEDIFEDAMEEIGVDEEEEIVTEEEKKEHEPQKVGHAEMAGDNYTFLSRRLTEGDMVNDTEDNWSEEEKVELESWM